jgi:hypothetical protein
MQKEKAKRQEIRLVFSIAENSLQLLGDFFSETENDY